MNDQAVLELILTRPGITSREIRHALTLTPDHARDTLRRLKATGEITATDRHTVRGKVTHWRLTE